MSHLYKTGIVGLEPIEDILLSALVTGDPILLIGPPGCGKTAWVERVSHLLGYEEEQIALYSAPTINFEDVVGIPVPTKKRGDSIVVDKQAVLELAGVDPKKVSKDEMNEILLKTLAELSSSLRSIAIMEGDEINLGYASTPTTIWNKRVVLWDELNRSKYDMQNQILQVIRDRRCSGIKLDLHYVFAAMNELNEKGTVPLDSALADRFSLLVNFPSFKNMKGKDAEKNKLKIITNRTTQDAVMLGGVTNPNEDSSLQTLLKQARIEYSNISCGLEKFVVDVVDALNDDKSINISGRRAGMLYRNLTSMFAIKRVRDGKNFNPRDESSLAAMIYYTMPQRVVTGEDIKPEKIAAIVATCASVLYDVSSPISKFFSMDNPVEMIVEAVRDKEIMNDKKAMGEILNTALQAASKYDKNEFNISSDQPGIYQLAVSFWALTNSQYFDKGGFERAVSAFNGIEGKVRTRPWDFEEYSVLTYQAAVMASTNSKETDKISQTNVSKFDGLSEMVETTNQIYDLLRTANFMLTDLVFVLLSSDGKKAKEAIRIIKELTGGINHV
jgi:MoxR-like ATPase